MEQEEQQEQQEQEEEEEEQEHPTTSPLPFANGVDASAVREFTGPVTGIIFSGRVIHLTSSI